MKKPLILKTAGLSLAVCGLLLSQPIALFSQDAPAQSGGPMGGQPRTPGVPGTPGTTGAEGKEKFREMMSEMRQQRQRLEQERQTAMQEARRQLGALQEHSRIMAKITDEKQLFTEMKKHQQMSDTLLSVMVDLQEKMGRPRDRRSMMPGGMGSKTEGERGFFGKDKGD